MHVLLVGAGNMAIEYSKVLKAQNIQYTVIGRGEERARKFEKETGKKVIKGGLETGFDNLTEKPTHVIIASTLENLESNALYVLEKGIKNILIEKPGSINSEGLKKIAVLCANMDASTFIAYNRRFYTSVIEAEKLIEKDGGLLSIIFEFTELSQRISKSDKTEFQLANWFIGNSTHVIDTAFYFGGQPKELASFVTGSLDWHPSGSIYAGAGITEKDILFSYHANWRAPGSWKLELLTKNTRYIFRPFEKLHIQKQGSFEIKEVHLNDDLDISYKPGLYKQTSAFLFNNYDAKRLLTIKKAIQMMEVYLKMNGDNK